MRVKIEIPTSVMIFIAYIYNCNPTYRVTLTANPTREIKHINLEWAKHDVGALSWLNVSKERPPPSLADL